MQRISLLLVLSVLLLSSCLPKKQVARRPVPDSRESKRIILPPESNNLARSSSAESYIARFKDIAIAEMNQYGIPASIKLAQALLESGNGNSTLARNANNHFGIKC